MNNHEKIFRVAMITSIKSSDTQLNALVKFTQAIQMQSQSASFPIEIVFAYPRNSEFTSLENIKLREYHWETLNKEKARRAMLYANSTKNISEAIYLVPNDSINYFCDCDLWVIVSQSLEYPLLPIVPSIAYNFNSLDQAQNCWQAIQEYL